MIKLYIKKNKSTSELLSEVLKEKITDDDLIYNEYGKPYLKNRKIYFNVASCDNYKALVISSKEVGIDMESIQMKKRIIDHVCNEKEKKRIKNAEDFTIMWVKKESYVKYLGKGLSYGLKNVDTLKYSYQIQKFKNYYIAIYSGEDN